MQLEEEVHLNGVPGREENLQIVMQPLRIDEVLDEAGENAAAGNLGFAADLTRDVLLLNAAHARANLLYGQIEMRRGSPEATAYLLRAVLGGETLRFPVKLQGSRSMSLVAGELLVTREGISVKSPERFELDLTILRRDVEVLNFSPRPAPGFISLAGRSDFHGRLVSPEFKIYPHDIVVEVPVGTTRCGSEGCGREIAEIARLLLAWRGEFDKEN